MQVICHLNTRRFQGGTLREGSSYNTPIRALFSTLKSPYNFWDKMRKSRLLQFFICVGEPGEGGERVKTSAGKRDWNKPNVQGKASFL
jgi:hypothetical protein